MNKSNLKSVYTMIGADVEIDGMTVEEIADQIGKTVRGVKTMLTRRGLQCADYNGAARKEIG